MQSKSRFVLWSDFCLEWSAVRGTNSKHKSYPGIFAKNKSRFVRWSISVCSGVLYVAQIQSINIILKSLRKKLDDKHFLFKNCKHQRVSCLFKRYAGFEPHQIDLLTTKDKAWSKLGRNGYALWFNGSNDNQSYSIFVGNIPEWRNNNLMPPWNDAGGSAKWRSWKQLAEENFCSVASMLPDRSNGHTAPSAQIRWCTR